jgi:hypothetical protein
MMADDAATVERLRAELRQLREQREADRAEIATVRDENNAGHRTLAMCRFSRC